MRHRMQRLWAYGWAAPCSAIGLALGLLALPLGARIRRVSGTLEISLCGRRSIHRSWLRALPFVAITFGHVIIGLDRAWLAHLRAHERVHVRQYERWGPAFLLAYPLASVAAGLRGRHPYRENRFEVRAREGAGR